MSVFVFASHLTYNQRLWCVYDVAQQCHTDVSCSPPLSVGVLGAGCVRLAGSAMGLFFLPDYTLLLLLLLHNSYSLRGVVSSGCVCSAEVYSFLASWPLHLCGRVGCLLVVTAVCRAAGRVLLCRVLLLSDNSWAASWQACRDGLFVGLTLSPCTLQLQL